VDAAQPLVVVVAKALIGVVAAAITQAILRGRRKETKEWEARDKELDAMADRERERQQAPTLSPPPSPAADAASLKAELARVRQEKSELCQDLRRMADARNATEEALSRGARESAEWRRRAIDAERRAIDADKRAAAAVAKEQQLRAEGGAAEEVPSEKHFVESDRAAADRRDLGTGEAGNRGSARAVPRQGLPPVVQVPRRPGK
jgi:hypothetical protein